MLTKIMFTALPFFVCLTWTVILFLDYRDSNRAKRMLAWFFAVCAGLHLTRVIRISGSGSDFDLVRCFYIFFTLAIYPLAYIYIRRLTCPTKLKNWQFLVLIPSLVVCIAAILASLLASIQPGPVIYLYKILLLVEVAVTVYYVIRGTKDYIINIDNYYSDHDSSKPRKLAKLLLALCFFSLLKGLFIAYDFDLTASIWVTGAISLIYTIILFPIGYIGSKIEYTAADMLIDISSYDLYEEDMLPHTPPEDQYMDENNANYNRIAAAIEKVMDDEKLYLRPSLKISDLARAIGSNRTYVSDSINNHFRLSFHDYVNSRRVQYAQELILKDGDDCLEQISETCGFASESAFYRNFKKFTGCTPNEYRKKKLK